MRCFTACFNICFIVLKFTFHSIYFPPLAIMGAVRNVMRSSDYKAYAKGVAAPPLIDNRFARFAD
jgi:hypothetical protein